MVTNIHTCVFWPSTCVFLALQASLFLTFLISPVVWTTARVAAGGLWCIRFCNWAGDSHEFSFRGWVCYKHITSRKKQKTGNKKQGSVVFSQISQCFCLKVQKYHVHISGWFITTSADVTPNGGLVRESPSHFAQGSQVPWLFQLTELDSVVFCFDVAPCWFWLGTAGLQWSFWCDASNSPPLWYGCRSSSRNLPIQVGTRIIGGETLLSRQNLGCWQNSQSYSHRSLTLARSANRDETGQWCWNHCFGLYQARLLPTQ